MKTSAVLGILACASSFLFALPASADPASPVISQKAKIGIALPADTKAGAMLKKALEERGYETALYTMQSGSQVTEQMINDGCNLILVGADRGIELDSQLEQAEASGLEITAYGSVLMHLNAIDCDMQQSNTAMIGCDLLPSEVSRMEMFTGMVAGALKGGEIYSALYEINPLIDRESVLARSGRGGRGILDRALDDSRSMIAQNVQ